METQTVQGYVRYKQVDTQPKQIDQIPALVVGGSALILIAVVFWQVSIIVGLAGAAGLAVKHLAPVRAIGEIQALTAAQEQPKLKRHYNKRIKVHMYDTGKTIRV